MIGGVMLEVLFWWTGFVVWSMVAVFFIIAGLPEGEAFRGVTRLTFYGFGPVVWHVLPENQSTFYLLFGAGYHFLQLGPDWFLGLSLPTWLSRRLFGKRDQA